jgi:hypothetical protein
MAFCKTVEYLYEALPLRPFQDWLIRVHMDRCPSCQARLLSREEARGLLIAPESVGDAGALWKRILSRTGGRAAESGRRPAQAVVRWRWAAVTALVLTVAAAGFWLLREVERPGFNVSAAGPAGRFEIAYVNVGGAPAQTFVYQPQGSDTVFVWAQKTP